MRGGAGVNLGGRTRETAHRRCSFERLAVHRRQRRRLSIAWFNALVEWNERIKSLPPNPRPIAIIQGNADSVVDWEYNLKFLVGKFPDARVDIIDVGRHQLLNEGPALRAEVLRIVDDVLAGRWRP